MNSIRKFLVVVVAAVAMVAGVGMTTAEAGLCGDLTVCNQSAECVKVFYNNRFIGLVHEGETIAFHLHDHSRVTTLTAFCEDDNDLVARKHWHGVADGYSWIIQ